MYRAFLFALIVITHTSLANASDSFHVGNDAIILSPNVFVSSESTLAKPLGVFPTNSNQTVIALLSWTDNTGDKLAKIEIVNITHHEHKNTMIFETKQWLPYTLSGEVVSLPVVLKDAKIKLL